VGACWCAAGPGSPCGKGISNELSSTLGKEKVSNPALQIKSLEEFIAFNVEGLGEAPQYFPSAVLANLQGADHLGEELERVAVLDPDAFQAALEQESLLVLDMRGAVPFSQAYIRGALNIPLGEGGGIKLNYEDGNAAIWIGTLIAPGTPLLLIAAPGKEEEALQRLGRIGYAKQVRLPPPHGVAPWFLRLSACGACTLWCAHVRTHLRRCGAFSRAVCLRGWTLANLWQATSAAPW
jgi:hypothetical protein